MKFFIDLETSGLDYWRNEILEMGIVITDDDLNIKDKKEFKFKPEWMKTWDIEAEKIHGISALTANDFPDKRTSFRAFCEYVQAFGFDHEFICHAFPMFGGMDFFDYRFCFSMFWELDERALFYKLFPEVHVKSTILRSKNEARSLWGIENQRLDTWTKKLGIDNSGHHQASHDALVCYEIYKYQQERGYGIQPNVTRSQRDSERLL